MKLFVFGSSSSGNAYALEFEDGQILLLEAGLSYTNVYRAFPDRWKDIIGCLLSHEHGDHAKYVKDYDNNGISIYGSIGTMEVVGVGLKHGKPFNTNTVSNIGINKSFYAFAVKHTAADPVGYLIFDRDTKESLLFITDTSFFKPCFTGVSYIMVECNHIKADPNHPWSESHLNLDKCLEFLKACDLKKTRKIILIHLSDSSSNEKLMVETIRNATSIDTVAATKGLVVYLHQDPF